MTLFLQCYNPIPPSSSTITLFLQHSSSTITSFLQYYINPIPPAEPNTGLTLWVQQFWALFVKRFYNSLRFYGALFSQLFLPLLFVVLGLAVAITVPSNQTDDAPRALLLNNSGLTPDNATTFFAQFGSSLNFSVGQRRGWGGRRMVWGGG